MDSGGLGSIVLTSSVGDSEKAEWGEHRMDGPSMASLGVAWSSGTAAFRSSPAIWASECAQVAHSPGRMTSPHQTLRFQTAEQLRTLLHPRREDAFCASQYAFLGHSRRWSLQWGSEPLPRPHVQAVLQTLQSTLQRP